VLMHMVGIDGGTYLLGRVVGRAVACLLVLSMDMDGRRLDRR
jgi:hypothetical protein